MPISGFPLSDQWAALVAPHTVLPAEMQARVDAQMNAIAAYIATFPGVADICVEAGTSGAQSVAQNGGIVYGALSNNPGGGYNTSNGVYTAPVAGTYMCYGSAITTSAVALGAGFAGLTGIVNPYEQGDAVVSGGAGQSIITQLTAGQAIHMVRWNAGPATISISQGLLFIRRIGA